MATRVYIVRHCQSRANEKRRYNCTIEEDEGLSEIGFRQAKVLGEFFKERGLRMVYTSPFLRTRQTAKAISAASNAPVEAVDEFRELDCGQWNGKSEDEIVAAFPDAWRGWHYDPQNNPIPGGESLMGVQARALPTFDRLVKMHRDQDIAIITHYCVFNVLVCSLVSSLANFRCFDTTNGSIAEIAMENVPRLMFFYPLPAQKL
jgi:probable phosphoglycerate mutase